MRLLFVVQVRYSTTYPRDFPALSLFDGRQILNFCGVERDYHSPETEENDIEINIALKEFQLRNKMNSSDKVGKSKKRPSRSFPWHFDLFKANEGTVAGPKVSPTVCRPPTEGPPTAGAPLPHRLLPLQTYSYFTLSAEKNGGGRKT